MFAAIHAKQAARRRARARIAMLKAIAAGAIIIAVAVPFLGLSAAYGHYVATYIY